MISSEIRELGWCSHIETTTVQRPMEQTFTIPAALFFIMVVIITTAVLWFFFFLNQNEVSKGSGNVSKEWQSHFQAPSLSHSVPGISREAVPFRYQFVNDSLGSHHTFSFPQISACSHVGVWWCHFQGEIAGFDSTLFAVATQFSAALPSAAQKVGEPSSGTARAQADFWSQGWDFGGCRSVSYQWEVPWADREPCRLHPTLFGSAGAQLIRVRMLCSQIASPSDYGLS